MEHTSGHTSRPERQSSLDMACVTCTKSSVDLMSVEAMRLYLGEKVEGEGW